MKVSFLGSGAWATALANVVSDNGHEVLLYGVCKDEIDDININHQNKKYFKDVKHNNFWTSGCRQRNSIRIYQRKIQPDLHLHRSDSSRRDGC